MSLGSERRLLLVRENICTGFPDPECASNGDPAGTEGREWELTSPWDGR